MDILTLEQRLASQQQYLSRASDNYIANSGENEKRVVFELEAEISDAIFFSNSYALYFAGHVGLSLLGSEKADIKNAFYFGGDYNNSKDTYKLTRILSKFASRDIIKNVSEKKNEAKIKQMIKILNTLWKLYSLLGLINLIGQRSKI